MLIFETPTDDLTHALCWSVEFTVLTWLSSKIRAIPFDHTPFYIDNWLLSKKRMVGHPAIKSYRKDRGEFLNNSTHSSYIERACRKERIVRLKPNIQASENRDCESKTSKFVFKRLLGCFTSVIKFFIKNRFKILCVFNPFVSIYGKTLQYRQDRIRDKATFVLALNPTCCIDKR
jgi:hypothetical protein